MIITDKKVPPAARALCIEQCEAVAHCMADAIRVLGGIPDRDHARASIFGASVMRSLTEQFGHVDPVLADYLASSHHILKTFRGLGGTE